MEEQVPEIQFDLESMPYDIDPLVTDSYLESAYAATIDENFFPPYQLGDTLQQSTGNLAHSSQESSDATTIGGSDIFDPPPSSTGPSIESDMQVQQICYGMVSNLFLSEVAPGR